MRVEFSNSTWRAFDCRDPDRRALARRHRPSGNLPHGEARAAEFVRGTPRAARACGGRPPQAGLVAMKACASRRPWCSDTKYPMQTLVDNISLLSAEKLAEISQLVVEHGHEWVKKSLDALRGRCDSFVVETDVHYPTDFNLLWDAMRWCRRPGTDCRAWRQQRSCICARSGAGRTARSVAGRISIRH